LCDFLYAGELITGNPMPLIGRPKVAKALPKGLGAETIAELLRVIDEDCGSGRRSDWAERDRAIVLTAVLAGLRADELVRADVGHIRPTDGGGVIHLHGKGNKDRRIPVERALIHELEAYLDPAGPLPRQHQTAAHQCRAGRLAGHCATVRRR
jgi:site-specific recombinase XerC